MEVKAKLSYLRMSPKKVRLVIDLIRGSKTEEAIVQLNFINKAAKKPVLKLLNSAIANAENNFSLKKDNLYIKKIWADEAGSLKRWQPRAHGRATPIRKGISHIHIVLDEIQPTKQKTKKVKKTKKPVRISKPEEFKEAKKPIKTLEATKAKPISKEHEKEADKEILDIRMEGKHRHKQHEEKRQLKKNKGFIKKIFNRKAG
ncbi:MAG TPA: 50S ribosomal protein L22 [Candidatus Uhrbacteria bacterium]|nr:50S ribosomal protein L22 [Candidatus Uhrbacteria bacterium]